MSSKVLTPPRSFNFAAHLLAANTGWPDRIAFTDDHGSLGYGALGEQVRRCAAALLAAGIKREERVLLLMHDCVEWPICFLGAIYAGIVPVAVNTLLTVDDYAYMLEHSRAQAALVSGALLPALREAMGKGGAHEVKAIVVVHPAGQLQAGEQEFHAFVDAHPPMAQPASTGCDDPGFWLYSSGSTGKPKGTVHSQANPYWTCELYAKGVLRMRDDDICFSAAKLFFAYGLGNALTFPMSVGASVLLMAERPTPAAVFKRLRGQVGGVRPTILYGAPTGYAGMLAAPDLPLKGEVS
ncbi:AMP-binding protein, partial [Pelomonas sp. KK5]|uniref:AMP-binding protein n=1 Tax=Pelomonas sp. KK5 TaxID=1855730 RepID=UPI00117BE332